MEKQELLNAIATLATSIDPLIRAKEPEAVKTVTKKLIELVANLK